MLHRAAISGARDAREGFSLGTVLAGDRMELCYLKHSQDARIASCVELTKQP
jgi:hypothetical protein